MIEKQSVDSVMKNGNAISSALTKRGLFVEAGVVASLLLTIQGLWQVLHLQCKLSAGCDKGQSHEGDCSDHKRLSAVPSDSDGTRDGV